MAAAGSMQYTAIPAVGQPDATLAAAGKLESCFAVREMWGNYVPLGPSQAKPTADDPLIPLA